MEQLELPEARQHHVLDTLQVWKHVLPDTRSALLPPHTAHPNPLVIGDGVGASVFSPGAVCLLDKASGQMRSTHKLDAFGGSCVTYAGGRIYAKSSRTVYCLDAASGQEYWKFSPGAGRETVYSFPTFHRDRVYFGDRAGVFRCLDARSGDQMWAETVSSGKNNQVNSTAVIYDDLVVVGSNDTLVAAYDTATGHGVWKQSTDGPCIAEILAQDGKIFATTTKSIYALDASTGEIVFRKRWQGMDVHWN
jgi:outer membrane protein assembly factor BamB